MFDGGTGEVARRATPTKLFSDRLKSVLATKCHLNDFLKTATYLKESDITEVKFPIVQMMGLDAHLCVLRLDSKKSYVLEEVCAFPFPSALHGIQSGGIENLINGLSNIESLLLNLERIHEESRYCQEDSMERVSRGRKEVKTSSYKSWITDVLLNDCEEEESEESEEEEEERSEDEEGTEEEEGEEDKEYEEEEDKEYEDKEDKEYEDKEDEDKDKDEDKEDEEDEEEQENEEREA